MASPIVNTFAVWRGLFLRETLDRFFGSRAAWVWLFFEPIIHMAMFGAYFSARMTRSPTGAPIVQWLIVGMLTYFVFRRTAMQVLHSVDCNKAFFAYRQVKPLDAAIVRGSVELFALAIIGLLIGCIANLVGFPLLPRDPLLVVGTCAAVWFLGVGYGLITSVIMRMIPESGHIFGLIMMPMYLLSGIIIPMVSIPAKYREWLMYNPVAHAVDLTRIGFFDPYRHSDPSLSYLTVWAASLFLAGMVLFKLFHKRLIAR